MFKSDLIQELTHRITSQIHPKSIILFGSTAIGMDTPESDIDLLVIWDEEPGLSNRQRRLKLRHLIGDFNNPLDLLTYTSKEIAQALTNPNSFTSQIMKEGKVIYDRLY